MPSRRTKQTKPAGDVSAPADLSQLWIDARPYMGISEEEMIENALYGEDESAAHGLFLWFSKCFRDGTEMPASARTYAEQALTRFAVPFSKITLGQAFGLERIKKSGAKPMRRGGRAAINGLVAFLHEQRGYALGGTDGEPGPAFEIASALLARMWKVSFSATALRKQFYSRNKK